MKLTLDLSMIDLFKSIPLYSTISKIKFAAPKTILNQTSKVDVKFKLRLSKLLCL